MQPPTVGASVAAPCDCSTRKEATLHFAVLSDASSALRWAIHRRRAYVGMEDPYVAVTCIASIGRAERIVQGRTWDQASRTLMAEAERVPEEAYAWLTLS